MQQSCTLSIPLFIFSLEVILNQIRNHLHFNGLNIKSLHFKLKAFADDLMTILEETDKAISPLCHLLDSYGQIYGLKTNSQKSIF